MHRWGPCIYVKRSRTAGVHSQFLSFFLSPHLLFSAKKETGLHGNRRLVGEEDVFQLCDEATNYQALLLVSWYEHVRTHSAVVRAQDGTVELDGTKHRASSMCSSRIPLNCGAAPICQRRGGRWTMGRWIRCPRQRHAYIGSRGTEIYKDCVRAKRLTVPCPHKSKAAGIGGVMACMAKANCHMHARDS